MRCGAHIGLRWSCHQLVVQWYPPNCTQGALDDDDEIITASRTGGLSVLDSSVHRLATGAGGAVDGGSGVATPTQTAGGGLSRTGTTALAVAGTSRLALVSNSSFAPGGGAHGGATLGRANSRPVSGIGGALLGKSPPNNGATPRSNARRLSR